MHIIVTYFTLLSVFSYAYFAYGQLEEYYDYIDYPGYGNPEKNLYRGYPFGISCSDALLFDNPFYFDQEEDGVRPTGEMVQCTISKNDFVIFNQTVYESHLQEKGIFEEADETWDNAQVAITLIYTNSSNNSVSLTCILNEPVGYSCSNPSSSSQPKITRRATVATSPIIGCGHRYPDLHLTRKESSNYTFWWYRGCERIERNDTNYEYVDDYFQPGGIDGTNFASLKIANVSFSASPGEYSCVLEKNEIDSNGRKMNIHLSTKLLCVTRKRYLNEPHVAISEKLYRVEPGADLQMIAHGHTGTEGRSLSQRVVWNRVSDDNLGSDLCLRTLAISQYDNPDCTSFIHTSEEYCESTRLSETLKQPLDDYFNSSYWIRNATKDQHQGTYQVTLFTTAGHATDTYTVIVEKRAEAPYRLIISLTIAGVLVITVLIVVASL